MFLLRSLATLLCLLLAMQAERRAHLPWRSSLCPALFFSLCGDYVLGHWGSSFEGFVSGVALFLLAHLGYVAFSLSRGRIHRGWFISLALVFGFGYYGFFLLPAIGDAVTSSAVLAYIIVSCLSMAAAIGIQTTSPATPGAVHHGTSTLPEDSASESSPSVPHSEDSASESSPSVPHSEESTSENTSAGPLPEDSASGRSSSSLLSYSSLPKALFVVGIACLLFSDLLIAQRRFLSDSTLYFLMMPTYFASQLLATHSLLLHTTKTNIPVS